MVDLIPDQFQIEDQGRSPLVYRRSGSVQRMAITHPDLPEMGVVRRRLDSEDTVREKEYWASQVEVGMGRNGRRLKEPMVVNNSSAAAPHTAAFLDYHEDSPESVYLDYVSRRPDVHGYGLGSRLVREFAGRFADRRLNFGNVLSPTVGKIAEELQSRGRDVQWRRDY